MNHAVRIAAVCALGFAAAVAADEVLTPKMFKGMQKGQWKAEMLDASFNTSGKPMPTMMVCTDNLLEQQKSMQKMESGCKRRFVKDTSSEAVIESVCPERTSTTTMKKLNADNVEVTIDSTGKRGPQHMKIHYTHLGACKAGQSTVTFDKNSEQCKKIRDAAAKMKDPDQAARMMAMCG
ncbi:MAG TPA: hypothetical protein VKE95_03605 [Burkholderiales bacterium]|nr:hypothetical protein [Burkholderiales bacterium]